MSELCPPTWGLVTKQPLTACSACCSCSGPAGVVPLLPSVAAQPQGLRGQPQALAAAVGWVPLPAGNILLGPPQVGLPVPQRILAVQLAAGVCLLLLYTWPAAHLCYAWPDSGQPVASAVAAYILPPIGRHWECTVSTTYEYPHRR